MIAILGDLPAARDGFCGPVLDGVNGQSAATIQSDRAGAPDYAARRAADADDTLSGFHNFSRS